VFNNTTNNTPLPSSVSLTSNILTIDNNTYKISDLDMVVVYLREPGDVSPEYTPNTL
jgi:hypothetical protein